MQKSSLTNKLTAYSYTPLIMKKFVLLLLSLITGTVVSNAQTKTAHLNYNQLIEQLPAYKLAEDSLVKLKKGYETELNNMQKEYQNKRAAFAKDSLQMSSLIKEQKRKELKAMEDNYATFREAAQKDIDAKRAAMIDPIITKVKETVISLAKEKGYAYVIDDNTQGYIYMSESDNLMDAAKKKLGLK